MEKTLFHPFWDGHTHTEFCRHANGEPTEAMIERAIELGFKRYSITEHAPVPEGAVLDEELLSEYALTASELRPYLDKVAVLKKKYLGRIEIFCGLEIDYLIGFEAETSQLLDDCKEVLDEIVLSLHFIPGKGGLRCIDWNPDDFSDGLIDHYGSIEKVHQAYWKNVLQMVDCKIEFPVQTRIGHLGLINKFIKRFPLPNMVDPQEPLMESILQKISQRGFMVDFNVAGLRKRFCGEIYLTDQMIQGCLRWEIPLVYGSDSHSVSEVGSGYESYQALMGH